MQQTRDNAWLGRQLDYIWDTWFPDVAAITPVSIRFVRAWKRRLAVIYLAEDESESFIGVNRLLRDERVPYTVCLVTIAHELVHYTHGFGSHHPRRFSHPHRGNVVQRELTTRGLSKELQMYTQWTTEQWFDLLPELLGQSQGPSLEPVRPELERKAAAQIR
ncbi:MAG: hypothetical protein JOZ39_04675 [Chloroflexi bacterium]|nr:hypothetical protein [Chloroflexota bacterium]